MPTTLDYDIWWPPSEAELSPVVDISQMVNSVRPKTTTRCQSCHSSDFDSQGRCSYCRQYPYR